MKKFLSTLILISIAISIPVLFASCDKDEPKPSYQPSQPNQPYEPNEPTENEDKFADLYGYWLNSDKSGAMEIKKYSNTLCKIKYYVYTTSGVKESSSDYRGSGSSFTAISPNGLYNISVSISSSTRNRILLKKEFSYASDLSSYVFTRVDEDEFYSYIEHGNSGNQGNQGNDDDDDDENAKKLIGTWVGKDYFSETYTITFYSSGKAKEVWSDGTDSESTTGTYTYSKGKITEWDMKDGSIMANMLGDCPWPVVFNSSTSMTIGSGDVMKITFTKK